MYDAREAPLTTARRKSIGPYWSNRQDSRGAADRGHHAGRPAEPDAAVSIPRMPRRQHPHVLSARLRDDVRIDFDRYPFLIPAVREIDRIDFHPNVTFFVGESRTPSTSR
jgi:hypothetical protein